MTRKTYNIGVEMTMEVMGGKWKPVILCHLRHGAKRPSDLKRLIPDISQKMLTQELRELEKINIIDRKVYNQVPPKVVYSLSDYGETLGPVLDSLCTWGTNHINNLQKAGYDITLREE
ncbi:helix-turn-helix domain-containing protein [Companilactobacillus sp.]|uniref:winged helix-turn-helix transcriptional regulator n=1 Tax=Companilactobacillus sp. TaxID=2767905 RepID=UPI002608D7DC|nr:helix-turn-helix domain-containing protein [Companilactobacillus sp.]